MLKTVSKPPADWDHYYRVWQTKDLLNVHSEHKFRELPEGLHRHLMREAAFMLKKPINDPVQRQHLEELAAGKLPFGFTTVARSGDFKCKTSK